MKHEYVEVDLNSDEKKIILKLASFFINDELTQADLTNVRKKWIRFRPNEISCIIGELSYHFNRCKNNYTFNMLDELIGHLENIDVYRAIHKVKGE
jgi:hypothetical protein